MMPAVNVCLVDFPCSGEEMIVPNEDSSYTIIINSRLSRERQLAAYMHALKHIAGNDFEKYDVQEIEGNAHKLNSGGYIWE